MDFSRFADIAAVGGHVHFPHPRLMDDVLRVMETIGLTHTNLVSVPNPRAINQNPTLIHLKAHPPGRAYIGGALDDTQALADPARAPEEVVPWNDAEAFHGEKNTRLN